MQEDRNQNCWTCIYSPLERSNSFWSFLWSSSPWLTNFSYASAASETQRLPRPASLTPKIHCKRLITESSRFFFRGLHCFNIFFAFSSLWLFLITELTFDQVLSKFFSTLSIFDVREIGTTKFTNLRVKLRNCDALIWTLRHVQHCQKCVIVCFSSSVHFLSNDIYHGHVFQFSFCTYWVHGAW